MSCRVGAAGQTKRDNENRMPGRNHKSLVNPPTPKKIHCWVSFIDYISNLIQYLGQVTLGGSGKFDKLMKG